MRVKVIDFKQMKAKADLYGISLNEQQLTQLDLYAELLVDWNNRINLTGITDSEGIMIRHFEDSMAILKYLEINASSTLIDVGTGAGFPGMVLKIVRPDLEVTLLDSLNKRIQFLNEVAGRLGVNLTTVHLRAEEGGKMSLYREKFDIACARAVSNLRELAEYCIPFVKNGGKFISMKGPDVSVELDVARPGIGTLGGKISAIHEYNISDNSGRTLIIIDKVKPTPSQFPRVSAKIQKKPL